MSGDPRVSLRLAVVAVFHTGGTRAARTSLRLRGSNGLADVAAHLPPEISEVVDTEVEHLHAAGVTAVLLAGPDYPPALAALSACPPVLFVLGESQHLQNPAVGICGSRHATEEGLRAAHACGEVASEIGLTIVSGHARGVDTTAQGAALAAGGGTTAVLAEGIRRFQPTQTLRDAGWDTGRAVVVSQFAPTRRWSVGTAMTRNGVIIGLSQALVVVEAGATGGTISAGKQALRMGRPVFALQFAGGTPTGNAELIDMGAVAIRPADLAEHLRTLNAAPFATTPTLM
ncbi:MAG: DNA-processing protein DprA [Actinobacteria bacterium]|nr:DNA-processing protein DprA [Actinomycetota bacterium]